MVNDDGVVVGDGVVNDDGVDSGDGELLMM